MRKVFRSMIALAVLALLGGCAQNIASIVDVSFVCPSWKEVTITKADVLTEGTARVIEGNNEARLAQGCPPDPRRTAPKKTPAKKMLAKPEAATS